MKRTNILLEEDQHKMLKLYSKKEGMTIGGLVRDAIDTIYKKKNMLEHRREVALNAYREGFISLGKLAEVFGLDPISTRDYLKKHGISPHTQDVKDIMTDAKNA